MKTIFVLLFVLAGCWLTPSTSHAQEDSVLLQLLTQAKPSECPTYIMNAKRLIPGYYEGARRDSIDVLLAFLDEKCCGLSPEFRILQDLLTIEEGSADGLMCREAVQSVLFGHWGGGGFSSGSYSPWRGGFLANCEPDGVGYDLFVQGLTEELLTKTDSLSLDHLYCRHLIGETDYVLSRLRRGDFVSTCLGDAYQREIEEVQRDLIGQYRLHWAFSLGIWMPKGASHTLGNKAAIGCEVGAHLRRLILQATLAFRFLSANNRYEVMHDGELHSTDHFFGGYLGAEVGLEAIRVGRFGLDLFTGLGYDGWDAIDEGDVVKGIGSLNVNLGGTARVFVNKTRSRYLGLQARYNMVKYGTGGGTDMSGNTISLHLVFGELFNTAVIDRAKHLHYYD